MQSRAVELDALALQKVPPTETEKTEPIPLLVGGIHTEKAPAELAKDEAVAMAGLHFVAGKLLVDTGYVPFGHEFLGTPQLIEQFKFADSTTVTLLVTSITVYQYVSAVTQWQLISTDPARETADAYAAGATDIELDDITGLVVGSLLGIVMDDTSQHISYVTAFPGGNEVTLEDPIPVGRTVALGAEVAVGALLSGDPDTYQVCRAFYPANAWVVFSNNIDPIQYFDQPNGLIKELGGLPLDTTCAAMEVFHSTLLLGNTTEAGVHLPQRVRQSDIGDPEGWTPGTDGVAAIYDLLDTSDYVLNLKVLGPWLMCYREASVMRGSYIGALNEVIFWEYMSREDGIQSQGAVVDVGASHVFVGTDNVYQYTGGYELPAIGEPVFQNFLAKAGDIYSPAKQTLFCMYVAVLREVWIFYPSSDVTPPPAAPQFPNKMLRYNVSLKSWQERVFVSSFVTAGEYTPIVTITWATAIGEWDDVVWQRPWTSRINTQNVPNIFLGTDDFQQIMVYDFVTPHDWGDPVDFTLVTREFGIGSVFTRWQRVTFTGTGNADEVSYSIDEGVTWTVLGMLTLGDQEASQTLWPDVTSTRLMLKLTGADPAFQLRYAVIYAEFESEW